MGHRQALPAIALQSWMRASQKHANEVRLIDLGEVPDPGEPPSPAPTPEAVAETRRDFTVMAVAGGLITLGLGGARKVRESVQNNQARQLRGASPASVSAGPRLGVLPLVTAQFVTGRHC